MKGLDLYCVFLVLVLARQGGAISCLSCISVSANNPNVALSDVPNTCTETGISSIACHSGVTTCMTMVADLSFHSEEDHRRSAVTVTVGDVILTKTERTCGVFPLGLPPDRCLSPDEFLAVIGPIQGVFSVMGEALMMAYHGLIEGTICSCDTDDCTPPSPTPAPPAMEEEQAPVEGALSCLTCQDISTDNPTLPLPTGPDSCSVTGGVSTPCAPGTTSCATTVVNVDYHFESVGDVRVTQMQRGCASTLYAPPTERCLSEWEIESILEASVAGLNQTFVTYGLGPVLDFGRIMTLRDTAGSVCICDTDDCTPPTMPLTNVLSCWSCFDMMTDSPFFHSPSLPEFCSQSGGELTPCAPGVSSCATVVLHVDYHDVDVGNIRFTRKHRGCALMPFTSPSERCLSAEESQPILNWTQVGFDHLLSEFHLEQFATRQGTEGSVCMCDTDDCTPPNPPATNGD